MRDPQIDMDTIETSNLNRQFLFRKWHVGQSKADVAKESVLKFRPDAKIQQEECNVEFFKVLVLWTRFPLSETSFLYLFASHRASMLSSMDLIMLRRVVTSIAFVFELMYPWWMAAPLVSTDRFPT